MRHLALSLFGVLGLLAQHTASAQEVASAVWSHDLKVLIADAQSEPAQQAAARLLALAEGGNSYAMYDVGSLARQSERKPGMALPYDPGLALKWLLRAFDNGRYTSAYKLALTYREIGDTLEAMAWAQVSDFYSKPTGKPAAAPKGRRGGEGMIASLMASLYAELGNDKSEAIRLRTIALLQEHGPRYESALKRRYIAAELGDIEIVADCALPRRLPRGIWQHGRARESAHVEALVRINAEGLPTEVHLLDFSRRALNATTTQNLVSSYRCPASNAPRWIFANLVLDSGRYRLAPK